MSEPLSATQILSYRSTRTACANDQAYKFLPISRTNLPPASNSSNCAAAAPYAGPLLLPRDSTNTCFLELTAIPDTSPKYIPSGNLKKSGAESNAMSGTDCPNAAATKNMLEAVAS